jgi:2-dehydro-3-deoxyphosphogluconate aldolase / (4S)-4-hydroxy-2-oxoglutarate aldolase
MTAPAPVPGTTEELLRISPVIPVVVVDDAEQAVPMARALCRGGIGIIEVTLRTAAGLAAIERIVADVPEIVVGAGTVTTPEQAGDAARAGASFIVTPGSPEALLAAVLEEGLPVLAGAATLTEIMRLLEYGQRAVKFFPAEAAGGTAYLRAVAGPLPDVQFCPTGGISAENAASYLELPNVVCVGGSWLTPRDALRSGDWERVERLAAAAVTLRR